jgi:hypothetical protein
MQLSGQVQKQLLFTWERAVPIWFVGWIGSTALLDVMQERKLPPPTCSLLKIPNELSLIVK